MGDLTFCTGLNAHPKKEGAVDFPLLGLLFPARIGLEYFVFFICFGRRDGGSDSTFSVNRFA